MLGEREPDRRALVVFRHERDLRGDDLADLGELLLLVGRPLVGRRRDLVIECPPKLGDGVEILGDGAADDHPAILAAVSRYCADRFWNGAKRSPMARTSGIESERPSA